MMYRSKCRCHCHDGVIAMHIVPCCEPDPKPTVADKLAAAETEKNRALASVDGLDLREGHIVDNTDPDQLRDMLYGAGLKITGLEAKMKTLIELGTHMTLLLPRLSRLSDARDQATARDLVARWDEAVRVAGS